ncbi:zinc ribbon domain-containing protein [Salirhabdus salicampi]|uniref:zinc ribbon domain-containing protein n=1 Tax=Salirhabdus salicampi TaxID=476102 RepID=UPI0020C22491|nr:zinc ribbon domain-containing protein [Salirhabdus salicampi]MCP8617365.1 zinc ribbon domain-containing protein [Salirhabdus salicampi]
MNCPNCGQEASGEKFCSNCGTPLGNYETPTTPVQEIPQNSEQAATVQANVVPVSENSSQKTNEVVKQVASQFKEFGSFLLRHWKKPSEAKNATENDFIPSLITVGVVSLLTPIFLFISLIGLLYYINIGSVIILPLIGFLVIFSASYGTTIAGLRLAKNQSSAKLVFAKFGAYLVPFASLYVLGLLFGALKIHTLLSIFSAIGLLGILFVIPTLILFENKKEVGGIDQIYTLLIIVSVNLLVFGIAVRWFFLNILGSLFGGIGGAFLGFT